MPVLAKKHCTILNLPDRIRIHWKSQLGSEETDQNIDEKVKYEKTNKKKNTLSEDLPNQERKVLKDKFGIQTITIIKLNVVGQSDVPQINGSASKHC